MADGMFDLGNPFDFGYRLGDNGFAAHTDSTVWFFFARRNPA